MALVVALAACKEVREPVQAVQAPVNAGSPVVAPNIPGAIPGAPLPRGPSSTSTWGTLGASGQARRVTPITTGNRLPETMNGDPGGLSREQMQNSLQAALPNLSSCFDGSEANSAVVSFDADPGGTTRGVEVKGVSGAAADCIQGVIGRVTFPRFTGNPVPVDYPISVHRKTEMVKDEPPPPPPPGTLQLPPPPPRPSPGSGEVREGLVPPPPSNFINP